MYGRRVECPWRWPPHARPSHPLAPHPAPVSACSRAGGVAALLAVVGPGILAGLSDDDPAGITTYSILGAHYGYELLWVLALSTAALIVFHELGVRLGVVTGKGLLTLVRERFGAAPPALVLGALVIANTGTLCAEFAGVAAAMDLLPGISRYVSVPLAAVGVSLLVLRENFRHVEHVLLALSSVFVAYVVAGILAHPDWGERRAGPRRAQHAAEPRRAAGRGRDGRHDAGALGARLHPVLRGRQAAARSKDLRYERVDVIVGAVLTGVIGFFVVVACAATLHAQDRRRRRQRRGAGARAARRQRRRDPVRPRLPRRGPARRGDRPALDRLLGLRDARPQAPTSTTASTRRAPSTSATRAVVAVAAGLVLIPGAPLISILFLSQALNAVLLLVLLPFIRSLGEDRELMGDNALGRFDRVPTAAALAVVAASVLALGVLAVL